MNYIPGNNPHYPAEAIKAGVQGTVVLDVLVHADGTAGTITYNAKQSTTTSADLIAAATDAVRKWHFKPQVKDGKPVDAYARVPITFNVQPLLDDPQKASFKIQS
jgi:TonB family protein